MKILKLMLIVCAMLLCYACNNNSDMLITNGNFAIQFKHNWNGDVIDFDQLKYTNANGDTMQISKLRYLISNIVLHHSDGSTVAINGYILIDLNTGNLAAHASNIPFNNYSGISFTFGFNEADNMDGTYNDLNAESWNWPTMLGGGYHFMQFEGKYDNAGTESPFAYHMGTAKVSDGVFEQNYFEVDLDGFNFTQESTLNIHMNIAEWFTNPYTWVLDTYNIDLMMNYDAQKLMQNNGKSVFSIGEIN